MEAPNKIDLRSDKTQKILQQYEHFLQPSHTTALHEENEIFYEKSDTCSDPQIHNGVPYRSSCLIQSGNTTTNEVQVEESGEIQETIAFNDKSKSIAVDAPPILDDSIYDGFSANVDLATFLARPVLIHTLTWSDGATLGPSAIQPWTSYFTTPAISRKLQNYAYLSANLKIKVLVNASPFYYGYAFCAYTPYSKNNPGALVMSLDTEGGTLAATCRQRIDILPAKSQGGEMLLPYINPKNWLRIGITQDFTDMGELNFWSTDILSFANAAAGPNVTIQVFAWAENVKVSGPTSQLPFQSGTDEYEETGPISGIASNVAGAAGALAAYVPPPYKPFALATQLGAEAVSSIARLFGYTNVPVIDDVSAFKNLPFHAMASSEISCPFEKLTIDPKNELSVDTRIAGGKGVDELTIQYLCGKKNIISFPNWSSANTPGATIGILNVSPIIMMTEGGLGAATAVGANTAISTIPMTQVARCFLYWRGTMVYRFKFICSQYHRGRVAILWDPANGTTADFDYTVNYSRVVDLAEENEVEIRVPFMQPYPYLKTGFEELPLNVGTAAAAATPMDLEYHNGRVALKVLTKQTSPVATADIFVYAEVSMEDADFACPRETDAGYTTTTSYLPIQSGDAEDKTIICDNIAKMEIRHNPNLHKIFNGECIKSVRSLFRRRCYYRTLSYSSVAVGTSYQALSAIARRPAYFGYDANGFNNVGKVLVAGNYKFNLVNEPLQNLFEPCFVGVRGAQNYEINANNSDSPLDTLSVSRYLYTVTSVSYDDGTFTTSTVQDYRMNIAMRAGRFLGKTGVALTNTRTQTGLQVQVPMYSRLRFYSTDPTTRSIGDASSETHTDNMLISFKCHNTNGQDPANVEIDLYTSIGTDYQLLHFVNVPNFWIYGTTPGTP